MGVHNMLRNLVFFVHTVVWMWYSLLNCDVERKYEWHVPFNSLQMGVNSICSMVYSHLIGESIAVVIITLYPFQKKN